MTNASTTKAVIRSEDQLPLRFYAHPLKLTLLFLIMASVCAIFIWLLFNPNVAGGIAPVAFLSALLFGYGAIAYLTLIILFVIKRRPLLDIDANGCTYSMPFTFGERFLPWDNIASISLATRHAQRSFYTQRYLIVHAERPEELPHAQRKAIIRRLLLVSTSPGQAISFGYFFLRASSADVEDMFQRIVRVAGDINNSSTTR